MKIFTTLKMGYSAGIYGCSAEYFTTIVINGEKKTSFSFQGLYGAEERVSNALRAHGFEESWTPSSYGQVKAKDMPSKLFVSEYTVLKEIEDYFIKAGQEEIGLTV